MLVKTVCIHGRQPALGRAELESLYGAGTLQPLGEAASGLSLDAKEIDFARLGGSMKLARLLTILDTTNWSEIENYLIKMIPEHLHYVPGGKFKLGMSVYGLRVSVGKLNATGLEIKKAIKAAGRSVRIIPNQELELNSAKVLHNQLTSPVGWELLLIRNGNKTYLAQTVAVQDIAAYAARDQARPKRDAKVGMLPPKLAQIIVNLATGQTITRRLLAPQVSNASPTGSVVTDKAISTVLDPFCGTGVILQEAALMGFNVYGTDLDTRMVEYSQANLDWLNITSVEQRVEQADALEKVWPEPFGTIASETYLGRPFSAPPKPNVLDEVIRDVDTIHKKFLQNVAKQTKSGFRLCLAVPAWKTAQGFRHLPCLDHLTEMGYTRLQFVHANWDELIYHRENQIVGRELVVLIRK